MQNNDPSRSFDVRKITTLGMLAALGIVLVFLIRFPIFPAAPFLEYDPADVAILIGTLIYGPLAGFILTVIVSFLQALLLSASSGWIGFVMHVASTGAMVIVAGNLYKRLGKNVAGICVAMAAGVLAAAGVMVVMNLILTPLFMGAPIEVVIGMLVPIIIPFNLIKAGINSLAAFAIFKAIGRFIKR